MITWDPIAFGENRNHPKYEDSNGSITYLQSITVKQLISLMTHDIGQRILKWVFYQGILDYTNVVITWDLIEFGENRNHPKYEDSNCSITYLQSNTVNRLISLINYMIQLISQKSPADQKYNTFYFMLDEQWFNLTTHDMRFTLVNPVLENNRSQATPGRMNVAAITIDGAFTTWRSRFLHAKQESEIMMILTSVLANLCSSTVGSLYLVPRYCPAC